MAGGQASRSSPSIGIHFRLNRMSCKEGRSARYGFRTCDLSPRRCVPAPKNSGETRPRTQLIYTRRSTAATNGATRFQLACSGAAPIYRRWKNWSQCCTRAKARWPFATPASLRNRRKRWLTSCCNLGATDSVLGKEFARSTIQLGRRDSKFRPNLFFKYHEHFTLQRH